MLSIQAHSPLHGLMPSVEINGHDGSTIPLFNAILCILMYDNVSTARVINQGGRVERAGCKKFILVVDEKAVHFYIHHIF